jgi:hypothetical protein
MRILHVNACAMVMGSILWVVMGSVAPHAELKGRLTTADVSEAIASGIGGGAAPFPLYPSDGHFGQPGRAGAQPSALVYTPFVRVALQAKAAYDRGIALTPADISPATLSPLVYIGFTLRVCCGEVEERFANGPLEIMAVFNPEALRNPATSGRAMQDRRAWPVWTHMGTATLRAFDIDPPAQVEAVAAFSVEVVSLAKEFRLTRRAREVRSSAIVYVAPIRGALPAWR